MFQVTNIIFEITSGIKMFISKRAAASPRVKRSAKLSISTLTSTASLLTIGIFCVAIPFILLDNIETRQAAAARRQTSIIQSKSSSLDEKTSNNNNNNDDLRLAVRRQTSNIQPKASALVENNDNKDLRLPRVLAFVFPQFHQEPLNDKFWGEGFTDWNNLRKAPQKNREGWDIPRPTELGYYDLTNNETRRSIGEIANEYNLDGFAYHHYWFYDKTHPGPNLHAPLTAMLKDGHPDVPFCLHWAATKWMNTWHGETQKGYKMPRDGVMQKQYFPDDPNDPAITEHYNWLRQFFHHKNYIKVNGQPLFMMYQKKPGSFKVLKRLRALAIEDGFPGLYITLGLKKPHEHLQPLGENSDTAIFQRLISRIPFDLFNKTVAYPNPEVWNEKSNQIPDWCLNVNNGDNPEKPTKEIPGIITSFDNTPRRNFEEAVVWSNQKPAEVLEKFRDNIYNTLYYETCCFPKNQEYSRSDNRFVMVNAWNEWAEGMALEPSDIYGRQFLEILRDSKQRVMNEGCVFGTRTQDEQIS